MRVRINNSFNGSGDRKVVDATFVRWASPARRTLFVRLPDGKVISRKAHRDLVDGVSTN